MIAEQFHNQGIALAVEHGPQAQANSRLVNPWTQLAKAEPCMDVRTAERFGDLTKRGPHFRRFVLRQIGQRGDDPWPCDEP